MLSLALKEWASVISALESGTQILLFRKGGISESSGDFHIENDEFLLYPTHEHQKAGMLKPEYQNLVAETNASRRGSLVTVGSFARVHSIVLMESREQADQLFDQHIWNDAYVDMRFDYKPDKPLYVIALRVFRLVEPIEFVEKTEYVGCKSWVPLDEAADTTSAVPVLFDADFKTRLIAPN